MAARPIPITVLFTPRRYTVLINNAKDFDGIKMQDIPFNAQIGIIGHELAHIVDYERYNRWGVLTVLMRYAAKPTKGLFEKEIDLETIRRGLGWQLHDWAAYAMGESNSATEEYRLFKRKYYLSPEEIEGYIRCLSRYSTVD